jgi:hypothetical protein
MVEPFAKPIIFANCKLMGIASAPPILAMAGVLWVMTRPALVVTEARPLQASPDLPTFKPVR